MRGLMLASALLGVAALLSGCGPDEDDGGMIVVVTPETPPSPPTRTYRVDLTTGEVVAGWIFGMDAVEAAQ